MKDKQSEDKPTAVSRDERGTKQAGEIRAGWSWIEPSVWTRRMLTALEKGVKGGKWFSLIDKVYSKQNLRAALEQVKRNKGSAGVDHETTVNFEKRLDENLDILSGKLEKGTYRPQPIKRAWIPKAGGKEKRPLGIPTVRDRIIQGALRNVIEPIFERDFAEQSYGFRPGRGCKDALRRVEELLSGGYSWVVDADLKSYFDTIHRERLMQLIEEKISDGRVIDLIDAYLKQDVMDATGSWTPELGAPQGAVISPLLSNIYLDPLDHLMEGMGFEMVRYADDFVILCRSEKDARKALDQVKKWTETMELTLHPDKTHIVEATQRGGFDFLGYHFERGMRWPRKKSIKKLKDTIRNKTRRANGYSLERIITNTNRTLTGWYEYFKHSHHTSFPKIDGWIRMRLRSILRKRHGGKGRGRGADHQRWPNAYFAELGLFSTTAAHAKACQSSMR